MTRPVTSAYEQTRRGHLACAMDLLPDYTSRLRWPRPALEAEQTRALRQLLQRAAGGSPWHRERLRRVAVDRFTPADLPSAPSA